MCLGSLFESILDGHRLVCSSCSGVFAIEAKLPILLIDDENRRIKADEIKGEQEYNVKKVPVEVHQLRNAFVDRNTELFLQQAGVSLAGKEVLAVGCSMAEMNLCRSHGAKPFCLDIVPAMTRACHAYSVEAGMDAAWVCGDGECLPFENETFDVVMVRQALHHMIKYYSAIAEFFRVLRVGGVLLIVDEPFCAADPNDAVLHYPAGHKLYREVTVEQARNALGLPAVEGGADAVTGLQDFRGLEKAREYTSWDGSDPERLLADKYHSFSVLNCICALRMHSESYDLFWPPEVGWGDESTGILEFRHGPNPLCEMPLAQRLVSLGNVSIAAKKLVKTTLQRPRQGLRPMPLEAVRAML